MRFTSLLALSLLGACGGYSSGSTSSGNGGGTDTGSGSDDGFGWDENDGSGSENTGDDEDTTNDDSDVDDTDSEDTNSQDDTDTDEPLASGSYDVTSGDPEPAPSSSDRVIIAISCDGDVTGLQAHVMDDTTGDQSYWFDLDSSGEDGPEHDGGEFLIDGEIGATIILWSEYVTTKDSLVKINGYAWNGGDWVWMAGGDSYTQLACLAVMVHPDGTAKLCTPEDNGLDGGDLVCDPESNDVSLEEQYVDAMIDALSDALEEYYGDTTDDSTVVTETREVCLKNLDDDIDEMVVYWLADSESDNWFTDSDIDNVSGSEGMLLWWDSSSDELCADVTVTYTDGDGEQDYVQVNGLVEFDDGTEDYLVFGNDASDSWADATIDGVSCAIASNGSTYGGDIFCPL